MHYEISEDAARELVAALEKKRATEAAQVKEPDHAPAQPGDSNAASDSQVPRK